MNYLSIRRLSVVALTASVITLGSCGGNEKKGEGEDMNDSTAVDTAQVEAPKTNVFYSIPSPIQLGKLLQKAGATYDKKLLNSTENVSKYSTKFNKALNLGVYGADMSYSAIFGQTQEVMNYLDCSKKIADELGASGAYASSVIDRLKKNVNNKDSLLNMISDIFMNSNETFKESEQMNTYLLSISGGFIEGLYVGTQLTKTIKDNDAIVTRIAELKGSLNNLVALLSTQESDADIMNILTDLKDIKSIYDEMQMDNTQATVKEDAAKNTITIGGTSKYTLSKEQLEKITTKAEALRKKITNQ
ncbi:MAG: hypothetical protein J0M08_05725 [Bacteroidetes bacterium]|nr:hypothetical protein [Bacteroidota bacterium]